VRKVAFATLVALSVGAVSAAAGVEASFPRLRLGVGAERTTGGGVVEGDRYVTRAAVVAWNRKEGDLTLYLLWRRRVTCATLRRTITRPGHLIQVHVTDVPRVRVGRQTVDPQVAFLTIYRNPRVPTHIAGLRQGAQLTFTRVDSYPGGVWHGSFKVPRRVYGDGKLYGYSGTFAAKWCQLRR
jgi:hypothetical protein